MSSSNRVSHPLGPWVGPGSKVLILGSFPSPKSREYGMYYGHPQNRFWQVMEAVFGRPVPESPEARKAFILETGLALWDTVIEAHVPDASDARMTVIATSDLRPLLEEAPIQQIYTTGRLATDLFKRYHAPALGRESIYLPSTSAANRGHWPLERLIEAYGVLLKDLG